MENAWTLPPKEDDIELPPSRIANSTYEALRNLIGPQNVKMDPHTRLCHSLGRSTPDLIQARFKIRREAPDAVIFAESIESIAKILKYCEAENIALIPFGGGSSVLGGVSPQKKETHQAVITLNLQKMDRVLEINAVSHTAQIQAGILGPDLEKALNQKNFTLGHFPQSFEFSTVGGWIATRGSGQNSIFYGNISDLVLALKVVTPAGILETKKIPASSTGPDAKNLLIGSEGAFGVIVEATLKITPRPVFRTFETFLVKDFKMGVKVVREIEQDHLRPSLIRLSDAHETQFFLTMNRSKGWKAYLKQRLLKMGLKKKKIALDQACFLLVEAQGSHEELTSFKKKIRFFRSQSLSLGGEPGWKWHATRFELPYLRDELLGRGILVDTFETAILWENVESLYHAVIHETKKVLTPKGLVLCHVSHVYATGACLYFTFLDKASSQPLDQWRVIKEHVTQTILSAGGTLSHHHGVGRDHLKFLIQEHGPWFVEELKVMKHRLDPKHILNPGKLVE